MRIDVDAAAMPALYASSVGAEFPLEPGVRPGALA